MKPLTMVYIYFASNTTNSAIRDYDFENTKSVTWITKIYNQFERSRFLSFGI